MTFILSIEETTGHSKMHGFHLGTIETTARQIAEEMFHARVKLGFPTVTVALLRSGKMFDCYDGTWMNDGED